MKCQNKGITGSLVQQFGHPSGILGWFAGQIMARRASNIDRNLWTVSLLSPKLDDTILEIGFGPGVAIEMVAEQIPKGQVIGLDHSMMMLNVATKRIRRFIEQGRVKLINGSVDSVSNLPYRFDKVFTVNSLMFWEKPEICLQSIHSKIKPGGMLAITHQPRNRGANHQDVILAGNRIKALLQKARLTDITVHVKSMKPVSAVCVTART